MAANVTCAICSKESTTKNLKTGYLGFCKHCTIHSENHLG